MTDDHREAMAVARVQNNAVSDYLKALEENPPRRGPRRSPERMENRIAEINATFEAASPLRRVQMIQERIDLENTLKAADQAVDMSDLEAAFVEHAHSYSTRKGISYAAWREMRVPASVLTRAGIPRGFGE